jgi:hypothetical protein
VPVEEINMRTKLIIVEGLPGSGKSTTAQMAYDILKDKGMSAELFSEGNPNHPADYEGAAYFTEKEFASLQKNHPESKDLLNILKVSYKNGYLIFYKKAMQEQEVNFDDELLKDIFRNDIYELPLDIHMELIADRWSEFAKQHENEDKIIIFECCFIQNPVTVTMIKSNSQKEVSISYVQRLAEIVKPFEPVLLYVNQGDNKKSFTKAVSERPKEWFEGFTNYYTKQGYGLHNNMSGFDGVIKVMEARAELEREILSSLEIYKYIIDNSSFDIAKHKDNVTEIIEKHL